MNSETLLRPVTVTNEYGLHVRVATELVTTAKKYSSEVFLVKDGVKADAKSIFQILGLGAEKGTELVVNVRGEDAQDALVAVLRLLVANTDEQVRRGMRHGD